MSMTYKYTPRSHERENNLFLEEYYSGTDTKVYINDEEQTEISYISYALSEQLKPIYGYSSRTFDEMAVGNRIVSGVLKIPIKNPEDNVTPDVITNYKETTLNDIQEMNDKENEDKSAKEWINDLDNKQNDYTNNEIFEYQNKLISLGYEPSLSGSYDAQTRNAIYKYQNDNKIVGNGTFTNDIIADIDFKITESSLKKGTVEEKTNVYSGLSTNSGVVCILLKDDEFYIVQELKDYTLIHTKSGKDGYIETNKIKEVG